MSGIVRWIAGNTKSPAVAGFRVPSSIYDLPIPLVYGYCRVTGNIIIMPSLPVPAPATTVASKTGKGTANNNKFVGPVAIAMAEGPIAGIGNVYRDKNQPADFSTVYGPLGWNLKLGTAAPSVWTTPITSQRVPYQYTAYVYNDSADFPNDSLPAYSWEVQGFDSFNVGGGIVDCDLADVLTDYLTDPNHGVGFPSARLGSVTSFYQYSAAAGLLASFAFDSQQPARDQLNELFEIGNTAAVWSDGVLKPIPYGDSNLTGNGQTYTANTTPLYDLGDGDFLPRGGDLDPILVTRTDLSKAYNRVIVEYYDRAYNYNKTKQTADDLTSQNTYGIIAMPTISLHAAMTADVARQIAQLRLQREQCVRNTYNFLLPWKYALLEPMDLVTLTDVGLGLAKTTVRLTQIIELQDERGYDVTAEEWPFGTASATQYSSGSASGNSPNVNADPGNTNAPAIFCGPQVLQSNPLEIWIAAAGGAAWGGCDVWISTDNTNFKKYGTIVGNCTYGTLTANLAQNPVWPATDSTHTLSVNVSGSGGTLVTQSASQFAQLQPLCYVDDTPRSSSIGEFLAYETATLTSAGHYDLTTLYRGLYGSSPFNPASSGYSFVFCDSHLARIPWPTGVVGQTIYIKLPAFNTFGGGLQDVGSVSSYSFTITKTAVPYQNSPSQGTVSIDSNGAWEATEDGPSQAQSASYAISTSSYPSDASAQAGTVVNGRTVSFSGGPLTFGQTIYITVVYWDQPGGTGNVLLSSHLRGAYQTFSGSKTTAFGALTFVPWANNTDHDWTVGSDDTIWSGPSGGGANGYAFFGFPVMTNNVTITQLGLDLFLSGGCTAIWEALRGSVGGSGNALLGSTGTLSGGGWQTPTFNISEPTSGRSYFFECTITGAGVNGDARLGRFYVTYTQTDPSTSI